MQKLSHLVAATALVALLSAPAGMALAQTTPPSTAVPSAATTQPAATTAAPSETAATDKPAARRGKKSARKLTRRQEIDRSVDRGTIPARYRNSVPKEYQQYIPFEKR